MKAVAKSDKLRWVWMVSVQGAPTAQRRADLGGVVFGRQARLAPSLKWSRNPPRYVARRAPSKGSKMVPCGVAICPKKQIAVKATERIEVA